MRTSRFVLLSVMGLALLLVFSASPVTAANPMVESSIRAVEAQLGDLAALPRGKRLGVLVITLANPYWTEMRNRYGEWAEKMGIEIEVMAAPTEGDLSLSWTPWRRWSLKTTTRSS